MARKRGECPSSLLLLLLSLEHSDSPLSQFSVFDPPTHLSFFSPIYPPSFHFYPLSHHSSITTLPRTSKRDRKRQKTGKRRREERRQRYLLPESVSLFCLASSRIVNSDSHCCVLTTTTRFHLPPPPPANPRLG